MRDLDVLNYRLVQGELRKTVTYVDVVTDIPAEIAALQLMRENFLNSIVDPGPQDQGRINRAIANYEQQISFLQGLLP